MKRLLPATLLSLGMIACAQPRAETGVTEASITLGQSAAITGPAQALGHDYRDGALAYFKMKNDAGGVYNRKINLKTTDDGYEPTRALANTRQLVSDGVFSLFGYVGTPTSLAALAVVNEANIPFFAPFTGAESLRQAPTRNIFHIRAGYADETEAIVQQLATSGIRKIGVVFQNDAFGQSGLAGVRAALAKRGYPVVGEGTVERNSTDVMKAVESVKAASPDAVIVIAAYQSTAAFIRTARAKTAIPFFWTISFVGGQALINELGAEAKGVGISQVMPAPWMKDSPILIQYRKHYIADGLHSYSYPSLEGFIAAAVFVEALERSGGNLTRTKLIKSLESMTNINLGGFDVSFGPGQHVGSRFVTITMVSDNGRILH